MSQFGNFVSKLDRSRFGRLGALIILLIVIGLGAKIYYAAKNNNVCNTDCSPVATIPASTPIQLTPALSSQSSSLNVSTQATNLTISGTTASDEPAAAVNPEDGSRQPLQSNVSSSTNSNVSTSPLQSNANINDPTISSNPLVESLNQP